MMMNASDETDITTFNELSSIVLQIPKQHFIIGGGMNAHKDKKKVKFC